MAARHGLGKTSALVHLATDKLLQGQRVIHVSFAARTDHILAYYDEIFTEISRVKDLAGALAVHDEIAPRRTLMNFDRAAASVAHVVAGLRARIEAGGFPADLVVIDEFAFDRATAADLQGFRAFAQAERLEVWFSVSLDDEGDQAGEAVPALLKPHLNQIDVLVTLRHRPQDGRLHLELVKDHSQSPHDLHLVLDPKTLLISQE